MNAGECGESCRKAREKVKRWTFKDLGTVERTESIGSDVLFT